MEALVNYQPINVKPKAPGAQKVYILSDMDLQYLQSTIRRLRDKGYIILNQCGMDNHKVNIICADYVMPKFDLLDECHPLQQHLMYAINTGKQLLSRKHIG